MFAAIVVSVTLSYSLAIAADETRPMVDSKLINGSCLAFPKSREAAVWSQLRLERRLISTRGRGESLCGPVCVVNVVQAIAAFSNREVILNPEQAFDLVYREFGANLYASQSVRAIEVLTDRYVPDLRITVRSHLIEGANDPYGEPAVRLSKLTSTDLRPAKDRRIVAYTRHKSDEGAFSFQHAQIFAFENHDQINIVDPTNPYANVYAQVSGEATLNHLPVPLYHYTNINPSVGRRFAPFGYISIDLLDRLK